MTHGVTFSAVNCVGEVSWESMSIQMGFWMDGYYQKRKVKLMYLNLFCSSSHGSCLNQFFNCSFEASVHNLKIDVFK